MAYNELEQRGSADFPVELFYVDKNHPRYFMTAHWHSEIEIIRILEGSFEISLNNNTYTLNKGDAVFINTETVHQGIPKNCVYECIVFHIDFLFIDTFECSSFINSVLNGDYIIKEFIPHDDYECVSAVNEIFKSLKTQSIGYKFQTISAFYKFFAIIVNKNLYALSDGNTKIQTDKNILKLKRFLSFIRENYDKQISLEDISKVSEMSPKYFGSFFKNMTGKTPIEYLNEYRIEKASHKLLSTDLNVTDIAFSCGFCDLSYFIKTFKKIKGCSPRRFRNKDIFQEGS